MNDRGGAAAKNTCIVDLIHYFTTATTTTTHPNVNVVPYFVTNNVRSIFSLL